MEHTCNDTFTYVTAMSLNIFNKEDLIVLILYLLKGYFHQCSDTVGCVRGRAFGR